MEELQYRRRRAVREQVVQGRQARKIVTPFNSQIGSWQQRLAWLNALGSRSRPEDVREVVSEAQQILVAVADHQNRFAAELSQHPPTLKAERRIVDTSRAFESVCQGAERLLDRYS